MIGRLNGKIILKQPPLLLLDVNGVGYEVNASMNTFYKLPELEQTTVLYTHLVVREDAQSLFGFADLHERELFRTLIKVNGVGPKLALAILSSMEPDYFVQCVEARDTTSLTRLPGVGKKTAERLVVEMADRLKDWGQTGDITVLPDPANTKVIPSPQQAKHDATSALIALGYKPNEAGKAISRVFKEELGSEQLIRLALQALAS